MIYAVEILDKKFIKIGFSAIDDVGKRISELQTGNPFLISPVLTTYGTLRQEQALHAALKIAFGRIRIPMPPNEWYPGRNPFISNFLEYLKYGPDAGLALIENYNPAIKQPGKKIGASVTPTLRWPRESTVRAVEDYTSMGC